MSGLAEKPWRQQAAGVRGAQATGTIAKPSRMQTEMDIARQLLATTDGMQTVTTVVQKPHEQMQTMQHPHEPTEKVQAPHAQTEEEQQPHAQTEEERIAELTEKNGAIRFGPSKLPLPEAFCRKAARLEVRDAASKDISASKDGYLSLADRLRALTHPFGKDTSPLLTEKEPLWFDYAPGLSFTCCKKDYETDYIGDYIWLRGKGGGSVKGEHEVWRTVVRTKDGAKGINTVQAVVVWHALLHWKQLDEGAILKLTKADLVETVELLKLPSRTLNDLLLHPSAGTPRTGKAAETPPVHAFSLLPYVQPHGKDGTRNPVKMKNITDLIKPDRLTGPLSLLCHIRRLLQGAFSD